MKRSINILLLLFSLVFIGAEGEGCEGQNDTDNIQEQETNQMVREAHQRLGMPAINNFTERRMFKSILEKRDDTFTTYSYIMDMQGGLHLLCESVGYGIPFSTQYTNPEREERGYNNSFTMPQPDPNGLFMPTSSSATYVMCGSEDQLTPVFVEENLIVSPFRINTDTW